PSGASLGTSSLTRSEVGTVPFLASVGMTTLAGKLVHNPVGSARFVPVRVRSIVVPRWTPSGSTGARVGACGLGGAGGGWAGAWLTARKKPKTRSEKVREVMAGGVPGERAAGGFQKILIR